MTHDEWRTCRCIAPKAPKLPYGILQEKECTDQRCPDIADSLPLPSPRDRWKYYEMLEKVTAGKLVSGTGYYT